MPEIDVHVWDRVTGAYVDKLDLNVGIDTTLGFSNVESNVFTVNIFEKNESLVSRRAKEEMMTYSRVPG